MSDTRHITTQDQQTAVLYHGDLILTVTRTGEDTYGVLIEADDSDADLVTVDVSTATERKVFTL